MAIFEQSNQNVRTGSKVLFCYDIYAEGDLDVVIVEVIAASPMTSLVEVKLPDGSVKSVTPESLAPYEDQDFEEGDRFNEADRFDRTDEDTP